MKLHLPKQLFTALLAAITLAAPATLTLGSAAWGATAYHSGKGAYLLGGTNSGIGGINTDDLTGIDTSGNPTIVTTIDSTNKTSFKVWADDGNSNAANVEISNWIVADGTSITIGQSDWNANRYFDDLHIGCLNINQGNGSASLTIESQTNHDVRIDSVVGSLSSVNNAGTLTIGTAADAGIDASTTALGGSIVNSGTLTLNGAFTAASFNGFATTTYGSTLTNTTHGYVVGKTATVIASGGTINRSDFSFILGETDITESLTIDSGSVLYIAEDAASSTGTIYEITSAYTTAVEYNGASGGTAGATGFKLGNGTTVKLTGEDYSGLTDGIRIAAGNDGSATVSIANGVSQTYASLGLGSLVTKESGSYVLNIDGTGTVVTTDHEGQTGFHTAGEISITNEGKLSLNNKDTLGWGDSATSKISILDGTLAIGGRQTCSTVINMLGGAVIQAAENRLTGDDEPMIQVQSPKEWTISGTGNVVKSDVKFRMNNTLNLNVDNGGELSIKGEFDGNRQLTKSGDGKLVLDGVAKTINGQLQMTGGTLQLGGATASDGLVTLAGGINHTAGTVKVAGKAAITGDSVLGGALVVDSTGNLTLGKTYTLTGSLSIAEGGRITGAVGMTAGESTAPEAGTNGWDSSIVTVLQTADTNAVNISGLNEIWWTDGNSYSITSSSSEGITSYTADLGVNYYVQDAANKVEYSTESGLTRARTIYMSHNTTLVVKENLSFDKVSIAEGASVNYEVDGAILDLSNTAITSGISSIDMKNESMVQLHSTTNHLGGQNARVAINMSGNSALSLKNGWAGNVWADINVDGSGRILGSVNGNATVIKGSIKGNGSLLLGRSDDTWSNAWKIESLISDNESGKLSVTFDATDGKEGPSQVTLSGANTYSGGTVITNGHLCTDNTSALGTGAVELNNSGVLRVFNALEISELNSTSATTVVTTGTGAATLTVSEGEFAGSLKDFVQLGKFKDVTDGAHALSLVKKDSGTLTLSGANTYTGGTTIEAGTVTTQNASALGTGGVNMTGGELNVAEGIGLVLGGALTAAADSTLTLNNGSSLTLGAASTIAGAVTGAGNIASNYNTTFSGAVSGWTGSFTNGAAMTLTFDGSANAVNAAITQTTGNLTLTVGTTADATFGGAVTANQINVNQNTTFNGAVTAANMTVAESKTVTFAGGVKHQIGAIDTGSISGINYKVTGGASLNVQQDMWMKNSFIILEKDAVFSHDAQKLEVIGTGNGSSIKRAADESSRMLVGNTGYTISNAEVNMSNSADTTLGMLLTQSSLTTKGNGLLTVSNSGNTITNLAAESGNVKLSASMDVDSISAKEGKTVTVTSDNTIDMGGGAVSIGTNGADATMTAKSASALAQLQEDASFTIQDMTLTNTTITAATTTTQVKLQNVTATNLALAQGKFTMNVAPTVGEGGTTAEFGSGVVSLLAVGSASLTLNMDVIGAYESTGAVDDVTLTITLAGVTGDVSGYGVDDWKALVGFEENSWLGWALDGAQYTVSGVATAAEGGVPSVNYDYTATGGDNSNVGRLVITISGLNVPEPASATLGLAALMMLCARRRRKA